MFNSNCVQKINAGIVSGFFRKNVWKNVLLSAWIFLLLFACIFSGGCSQQEEQQANMDSMSQKNFIKPIQGKLVLERRIRRSEYIAGKPGQMLELRLRNADLKDITIPDWFSSESQNVCVYYAFCEPGKDVSQIEEKDWIQIHPDENFSRVEYQRTILTLSPGNSALIDVPLHFLENFQIPKNHRTVQIAMKAELNLNSVSSKTEIFELIIRPQTQSISIQ